VHQSSLYANCTHYGHNTLTETEVTIHFHLPPSQCGYCSTAQWCQDGLLESTHAFKPAVLKKLLDP